MMSCRSKVMVMKEFAVTSIPSDMFVTFITINRDSHLILQC